MNWAIKFNDYLIIHMNIMNYSYIYSELRNDISTCSNTRGPHEIFLMQEFLLLLFLASHFWHLPKML